MSEQPPHHSGVNAALAIQVDSLQHFYLRYPGPQAHDCVLVSDGKLLRFPSRTDALTFALRCCYEYGATEGEPVINIEGSDGLWRSFDCRLLPLAH